jgi:uncharacterized transporter YbjL
MHTISTRDRLNVPVRHQLLKQASEVASHLKSTDVDMMCVGAFVSIGLVVTFYSLLFGSFSQEISSGLSSLSQGLLETPSWDGVFL